MWPLRWAANEDPDRYMGGHSDPDAIAAVDVAAVLTDRWDTLPASAAATDPVTTFPGLAPANPLAAAANPFADPATPAGEPTRLLLVACNRPADAITALGGLACSLDAPIISAVLRSWEQRVTAIAIEVAPSAVTVAVLAPPTTPQQALALAAEQRALAPTADSGQPGSLRSHAQRLLTAAPANDPPASPPAARDRWEIARTD